jgi:alpha-1,3-rhamnosyl/mannosyltransferase
MLVLPSHLEGFGLPVLEAMTAGVPVIVSTGGALPEVAGDAASPIAPDDVQGFADAMARYLADPACAAAAVERGLARSRAYSWDASARTLIDVYRAVLARRSSSERATASAPRERSGDHGGPASERAGGSGGAKPPGQQ